MFGCDCCSISSFIYAVGVFSILTKVLPWLHKKFIKGKAPELNEKNYQKDVVYLYQFNGTPTVPSMSPFCVKVEGFLRLHNIKFERRYTMSIRGRNGLLPMVELNGEILSDSQMIIRRLTQIYKIKPYKDEQTAAMAHAIDRLLDNHTCNLLTYQKTHNPTPIITSIVKSMVPAFVLPIAGSIGSCVMTKMIHKRVAASIGKFTDAEYNELLKNDLVQLQTILGKNKFLMGDEPTAVDCTALGQLGVSIYAFPEARNYIFDLLESSELRLLKEYVDRTRDTIFGNEFHHLSILPFDEFMDSSGKQGSFVTMMKSISIVALCIVFVAIIPGSEAVNWVKREGGEKCAWFGTAWFCKGECNDKEFPVHISSFKAKRQLGSPDLIGIFGEDCWTGDKALCCDRW